MAEQRRACPECGSEKVTTIRLPRPVAPGQPPATQMGFRCLECDTQWVQGPERDVSQPGRAGA
jgi:hypothetical protein